MCEDIVSVLTTAKAQEGKRWGKLGREDVVFNARAIALKG
jgi:hypothetical protein